MTHPARIVLETADADAFVFHPPVVQRTDETTVQTRAGGSLTLAVQASGEQRDRAARSPERFRAVVRH